MQPVLGEVGLPEVALSSEHFFDDVVFQRALTGQALPIRCGQAMLVEFPVDVFPTRIADRFFDLRCRGIRRCSRIRTIQAGPGTTCAFIDPLVDGGAVLLLDVAAVVGKYGRPPSELPSSSSRGLLLRRLQRRAPGQGRGRFALGITRLESSSASRRPSSCCGNGRFPILKGTVDA